MVEADMEQMFVNNLIIKIKYFCPNLVYAIN